MKKAIGLVVTMVATVAMAQTWLGEYQWVATDEEKAVVEKAVEEGAQQVGRLIRSVARGRLKETTKPFQTLSFAMEDGTMTMVRDDDSPIVGLMDGNDIEWKRKDGKTFTVTQILEKDVFMQTFTDSEGNTRVNTHTFDEDGKTLTLAIVIKSSSLKTPLTYELTYAKRDKDNIGASE